MPNAGTTPTVQVRRNAPAVAEAETAKRGDVYDPTIVSTPQSLSSKEFYAELTKRSDMREILKQLAEN